MSPEFLKALGSEFNFAPPEKHDSITVCSIEAMHKGSVKIFVGLGGNFWRTRTPSNLRGPATMQVDGPNLNQLNRGALITGGQALSCRVWAERNGTFKNPANSS